MAVIDDFFGKNAVKNNKVKRKAPTTTTATATTIKTDTDDIKEAHAIKKQKIQSTSKSSVTSVKKLSNSIQSAEEILKTIPDADPTLLETDPDAEKMNFFQLKAKQSANSDDIITHTKKLDINSIPKGRENCLNGLTIVFTGVLPSLDREQCEELASKYGAKITKSISGKTSLVIIGTDAGPSKVKKIKSLKTKCIDENGFIELISKMPENGGSGELAIREMVKKKELEKQIEEEMELEIKKEKEEEEEKEIRGKNKLITSDNNKSSFDPERKVIDKSTQLWTDKYAPTDIKHICGNKGNVELLNNWLATWFKKKHDLKGSNIDDFKAVLISGPPGIGKTTTATLLSKKLGYEVIEKNASDFRSKKLLNDQLKVCLDNTSVSGFFHHKFNINNIDEITNKRFVLLMDEVDGMSSGDNGGLSQLAQFCKITKTPMILICNDKSLPKMRTLDKCCYDLVWRRPTAREMKSRLMSIAHREGLKLDPNLIDKLVAITHNDIRQIINIMSTVARNQNSLNFDNLNEMQNSWDKEVSLKPFDVISRLLSVNQLSINDKIGLYFNDMDLIPLMIHENYRMTIPQKSGFDNLSILKQLSKASDLISQSDLVNQKIRSGEQQWSLLPLHAIMSTVYPAYEVQGKITNRINFAGWLGQNSKRMKFDRIVQNLQYHTCIKTNTNNIDLRLDYIPLLKDKLVLPLIKRGLDGISEVLELMDDYFLTKEDFDNILELSVKGNMKVDDLYKKVSTSVKSGFTRKYNSYVHPTIIYKTGDSVGKPGKSAASSNGENGDYEYTEEDNGEDNGEDKDNEDITKDSLIKEVKPKKGKTITKKAVNKRT
jgi:replication factor C subunit 1